MRGQAGERGVQRAHLGARAPRQPAGGPPAPKAVCCRRASHTQTTNNRLPGQGPGPQRRPRACTRLPGRMVSRRSSLPSACSCGSMPSANSPLQYVLWVHIPSAAQKRGAEMRWGRRGARRGAGGRPGARSGSRGAPGERPGGGQGGRSCREPLLQQPQRQPALMLRQRRKAGGGSAGGRRAVRAHPAGPAAAATCPAPAAPAPAGCWLGPSRWCRWAAAGPAAAGPRMGRCGAGEKGWRAGSALPLGPPSTCGGQWGAHACQGRRAHVLAAVVSASPCSTPPVSASPFSPPPAASWS